MNDFQMNGSFGGNTPQTQPSQSCHPTMNKELWIDIICCSILFVGIVLAVCFWSKLSDALFYHFLYPIISVGIKVIFILVVLAMFGAYITRRLKLNRHMKFFRR